jgi:hypothetical protein
MHILVKELDAEYAAQFPNSAPHYLHRIECPGRPHCDSRQECLEEHTVDGREADDGPYDCADTDPWCGQDEFEFHGVPHLWMDEYGWTTPFDSCGASTHPWMYDTASDLLRDQSPGRYPVRVHWGEDDFEMKLIEVQP